MLRKHRRKLILIAAGIAVFAFASAGVDRLWHRITGAPRLLSVEELPDDAACYRPVSLETRGPALSSTHNLFSDFGDTPVEAQEAGTSVNLERPPVRILRDTAPIYSSVAVDDKRNEVFLQDNNLWSIRVFSRLDNAKPGTPPPRPGASLSVMTPKCNSIAASISIRSMAMSTR